MPLKKVEEFWAEHAQNIRCVRAADHHEAVTDLSQQVAESRELLDTARSYIVDLADSLGNACEGFEGDPEDDPGATGEVEEARAFAAKIREFIRKE